MKLVSYLKGEEDRVAILHEDVLYPLNDMDSELPDNMLDLMYSDARTRVQARLEEVMEGNAKIKGTPLAEVQLVAPVPHPMSCRDAYAFRQHVAAARQNRGLEMIPEYDQFPIFYFTNHNAITGPGELKFMPDHFEKLDFELEVAIVIGLGGSNISAKEADQYIAGYTIMNDWSARTLQMEEMKLNLGPAKGKDFATTIGPWLVTVDELQEFRTDPKEGHVGEAYDLKMTCSINGEQVSEGSMADMDWTFAEIIERVSYGTEILPGDIIGSGTVGTGCFLELNGTGLRLDPDNYQPRWVEPGDEVAMTITGLGTLVNKVQKAKGGHSLLELKKNLELKS